MYAIRHTLQRLSLNNKPSLTELVGALQKSILYPNNSIQISNITTTNIACNDDDDDIIPQQFKWLKHNETIFPVQSPGEERRPAYICHMKENIKYSPKKMWYIACFIRGMSVDEAVKQLSFLHKKGAAIAKETILEAQELAVENHNVEFKSNLWIAESFCTKGLVFKGIRRHARCRIGRVSYRYCHYFVRLEEGKPPKDYYAPAPLTGAQKLDKWMEELRNRKIHNSL